MKSTPASGKTADRAVVWSTMSDFADGDAKRETFAARFQTPEHADTFKEMWNKLMKDIDGQDDSEEEKQEKKDSDAETAEVAESIEKIKISESEK